MLELFFRRHFWVVHVVLLAVAAYLLATTIHIGTEQLLRQDIKVTSGDGRKAPKTKTKARDFDEPNDQNIFMGKRELLVPPDPSAQQEADAGPDEPDAEYDYAKAVLSELDADLKGVSVFLEPTYSLASIVDNNEGRKAEARIYSINDCDPPPPVLTDGGIAEEGRIGPPPRPCKKLMDVAELVHIALDRVYVKNNDTGRLEFIPLEEDPNAPKKAARRPSRGRKKPTKDSDLGKGIKKVGANSYEVEQSEVDKALSNLSSLATQARIVPAFEGGKAIGFKLFSIRPGSLYSKIGVQNGDVIQKVNGYEMNSPDQALEVYQKLKDSKSVSVDIKRRGKPVTLDYAIK